MFIDRQDPGEIEYYTRILATVGSLSRLFSDSDAPYLAYRAVENLFCRSFNANNLSRSDTSVDATKNNSGIGIKTFLHKNGQGFQKIAEFNREMDLFRDLPGEEKVRRISELRNERIFFTQRNYNLQNMLYHCVTRSANRLLVSECPMDPINLNKIRYKNTVRNGVQFEDDTNVYSFNISKSTLFKQFDAGDPLLNIGVVIIPDPFDALERLLDEPGVRTVLAPAEPIESIYLPLYAGSYGKKLVPEKSGLNQWNAAGRPRDPNEIYIHVPSVIHERFPGFFPDRDTPFSLILPNKSVLNAKICQENSKALMSNPNVALGKWLLRNVLNLKELELLTYEHLETLGVDSVAVYKESELHYSIDFTAIGTYEEFMQGASEPLFED
tara:strand:+ start:570 stop:1718 length:1149 start_codon:yes stop_codon:yes gene_type:complete